MSNKIWRISPNSLVAYTEDHEIMKKIRRSYKDFEIMATYYDGGEISGLQYRVPSDRKRSIRNLLGVNVDR